MKIRRACISTPTQWRTVKNFTFIFFVINIWSLTAISVSAEETDQTSKLSLNQLFGITASKALDNEIRSAEEPLNSVYNAFKLHQRTDPSAQVSWFRGHVDSYSAKPKTTIPRYALPALKAAGIEPEAVPISRFSTTTSKKPRVDWDKNSNYALPFITEEKASSRLSKQEADIPEGKADGKAIDLKRPVRPPSDDKQKPIPEYMQNVAHKVLLGLLQENQELFEISERDLASGLPNLQLVRYGEGRFYKRLVYQQRVGSSALHNGKTVVMLDPNWNVIHISRILLTESKMKDVMRGGQKALMSKGEAISTAMKAVESAFGMSKTAQVTETTLGIESIKGIHTWKVRIIGADRYYADLVLSMDAATGTLLNVTDNIDRYTDAKVSRWGYSGGDLTAPVRYTSENFYTRDDNTLVHDFFHVVTDNRNNGDTLHNCNATPQRTDTESAAYGTTSGSNYIRPTRRSDRDFSLWWPSEVSGTFGEAHTYYWARWFMQWMKPALADLGVLPASASDYPRALIIANACEDGVGWHSSNFAVTTLNNVGEGTNTIRLPERCRSSNNSCSSSNYSSSNSGNSYTYEGNAGYSTPGVIHHELNHFVMKRYFDIGSGLDCGSSVQLKFLHEGAAGRSLPQSYWHNYYGSGYAPSNQNRNYRHNQVSGRPHVDNASLNKLTDYLCASDPSSYEAGSVVHQAMWKFYHGIAVNGSTQSSIARLSTDRDFVLLYYWAMDLVSASTYQDRYEMANRVMEIMENHSNLSSSGKQAWCDVWDVHELDNFITSSYCS